LGEKKLKEEKGSETAQISDQDIKKAYEKYHARHILIKIATDRELASDWLKKEREKGTHKIEYKDLELKAYRYLSKPLFEPGAGEVATRFLLVDTEEVGGLGGGDPPPREQRAIEAKQSLGLGHGGSVGAGGLVLYSPVTHADG